VVNPALDYAKTLVLLVARVILLVSVLDLLISNVVKWPLLTAMVNAKIILYPVPVVIVLMNVPEEVISNVAEVALIRRLRRQLTDLVLRLRIVSGIARYLLVRPMSQPEMVNRIINARNLLPGVWLPPE